MKPRLFFVLAAGLAVRAAIAAQFTFGPLTLTVPDGFTVERVAGPPLVDRPIEADFDEEGRLYVTDSSGSNEKVEKQLAERPHRIVRLRDRDGDGVYDERTIFADKMMFPEGALFFEGSLYVSAPPVIWKLTDTDGDGVADLRQEWFQGQTLTGCANDLHGPYAGLDGWIYWTKGAFAKQTHAREGREPIVTRAAHIFRARPDGSGLEAVMTGGMDNPVGVTFSPEGERFFSSTFLLRPEAGRRDGVVHAIYGGVYGKDHDVVNEHPRTGELMPIMTHLGPAAPAGLHRYESAALGPDFAGNLFVAQFNLRKVSRHILARDGATFKTADSDFVSSDNTDFHPTDVFEDADGSLVVIDTGGWYKLCCPTSQLAKPDVLGAIYRIRQKGGKFARRITEQQAIAALAREKDVQSLRSTFRSGTQRSKLNALWAAARLDSAEARKFAREALADSDSSVRVAAAHNVSLWRDKDSVPDLIQLLSNNDLHVRRVAAEALGRMGQAKAVRPILAAAAGSLDRTLEHSLAFALIEIGSVPETRAGLNAGHVNTKRVALLALSQLTNGLTAKDIVPLLTADSAELRQTAAWIAERRGEWVPELTGHFQDRLENSALSADERQTWERILARLAKTPEAQSFLYKLALHPDPANQIAAFRVINEARIKTASDAWMKVIATQIKSANREVRQLAILAARELPPKTDATEIWRALTEVAEETSADPATRIAALRGLREGAELSEKSFAAALESLSPSTAVQTRADAVATLQRCKLSKDQLLALARAAEKVGPMELTRLLDVLEKNAGEEAGLEFVAALKNSAAAKAVPPEVLRQKLSKFPERVRAEAAALLEVSVPEIAEQRKELESRLARLKDGDIRRGQALFNSPKTACASCHTIGYVGGKAGPDLTTIGTVRTEIDLLEAILYPSASFVRSYEPVVVQTKDGETRNGVLRGDSDEAITLVLGPNAEERIARAEITEMRPGSLSIMPAGLDTQLTEQEMADLVAFLKGTKWGAN